MRPSSLISPLCLFALAGCGHKNVSNSRVEEKIKLTFEVMPEAYDKKLYYVEWTDTVGQSKGYNISERPKELQCVIKNERQDTLGYYLGLSTPKNFAHFQSTGTIVILNFKTNINVFSESFNNNDSVRQVYLKKDGILKEFEPITVNIKKDLREKIIVVIGKKER